MSDILYSKLRLEVPQALDGEDATITSSPGVTRTVEMSSPITDVMLAGMEKYRVHAGLTNTSINFGYGQIKKVLCRGVSQLSVTNMPTRTTYETGEALDLTGISVIATIVSADGTSETIDVTTQCTFNPANGEVITVQQDSTISVVVSYAGVTTSFNVDYIILPVWDSRGFNYNSWDTIAKYVKTGKASQTFQVGNSKTFTVNGKTYSAEVVAINDGTGSAGSWYPDRTVDFITKELYETSYKYNTTTTVAGGFPGSQLKTVLENTIYPLLPNDLKNVIISKSHQYNSSMYGSVTTVSTMLWLPTHYEITGGTTSSYAQGETSSNNKQYSLANKVKYQNGSSMTWWLSTIYTNTSNYQMSWVVKYSNSIEGTQVDYAYGMPICFRIG